MKHNLIGREAQLMRQSITPLSSPMPKNYVPRISYIWLPLTSLYFAFKVNSLSLIILQAQNLQNELASIPLERLVNHDE